MTKQPPHDEFHDALVLLAFALLFALVNVLCRWLAGFTDIRSELAAWALLIIAGLAAATGNNGIGIAGVDWKAKIIGLFQDRREPGSSFYFAANPDPNARVFNYSYQLQMFYVEANGTWFNTFTSTNRLEFTNAYMNNKIAISLVGNYASGLSTAPPNVPTYPGAYEGVMSVGAVDFTGKRHRISSKGKKLDVVAPSDFMFTTNGKTGLGTNGQVTKEPALFTNTKDYEDYGYGNAGTSFAAPLVTGVASLMTGYARDVKNMVIHNDDVMNIIRLSAEEIHSAAEGGPYIYTTNNILGKGWNEEMGYGLLNAYRALWYIKEGTLIHTSTKTTPTDPTKFSMNVNSAVNVTILEAYSSESQTAISTKARVVPYEIQQVIDLPSNITGNIKVWGTGALMRKKGYALYDTATTILGYESYLTGLGWCQPILGTINTGGNRKVTLRTYVYNVLDNSQGFPTTQWIPCRPEEVEYYYSIFVVPQDPTDIAPVGPSSYNSAGSLRQAMQRASEQPTSAIPLSALDLKPNMPNPFADETILSYALPDARMVSLEVSDMLGRTVHNLVHQHQEAGYYTVPLMGKSLQTGVYHVRLKTINSSGTIEYRTQQIHLVR